MRRFVLVFVTIILALGATHSDEGLQVRYLDPSGRVSLSVSHEIEVLRDEPVEASRDFSFDLALTTASGTSAVTVTIDRARATYVAHGMKQRLGTHHLTNKGFPLSIADGGLRLALDDASGSPAIDLGPVITEGFTVDGVLADALPVLPETGVAVGTYWTTERSVRSLEAWAWTTGRLKSHHRITAIDRREARIIVSVKTQASAKLGPTERGEAYSGDLKRNVHWTFDVTDGRLLTISIDQETLGVSVVPQGEIRFRQRTRVEMAPLS